MKQKTFQEEIAEAFGLESEDPPRDPLIKGLALDVLALMKYMCRDSAVNLLKIAQEIIDRRISNGLKIEDRRVGAMQLSYAIVNLIDDMSIGSSIQFLTIMNEIVRDRILSSLKEDDFDKPC